MASIGLLYLIFEDSILGVSEKGRSLSRTIIGVQVGLIILSMDSNKLGGFCPFRPRKGLLSEPSWLVGSLLVLSLSLEIQPSH